MSMTIKEKLDRLLSDAEKPPVQKRNYTFYLSKELMGSFESFFPKGARSGVLELLIEQFIQDGLKQQVNPRVLSITQASKAQDGD